MINLYMPEYETITTTKTFTRRLTIVPESIVTSSSPLSSFSFRINTEVLNILYRLGKLVSKFDPEIISYLLFQPTFPWNTFLTFLENIHEFMRRIGLRMNEHFQIEFSQWVDYEVEGWSYLQIKIILLVRGIDKFMLLKSLISMATQILPKQTRHEITISVE